MERGVFCKLGQSFGYLPDQHRGLHDRCNRAQTGSQWVVFFPSAAQTVTYDLMGLMIAFPEILSGYLVYHLKDLQGRKRTAHKFVSFSSTQSSLYEIRRETENC